MDVEIQRVEIEENPNLSASAILMLRRYHLYTGIWLERVETNFGSRTPLYQKLRRQLDVLDELMVMGRRRQNLLDQIRILSLIFVDNELYYIL